MQPMFVHALMSLANLHWVLIELLKWLKTIRWSLLTLSVEPLSGYRFIFLANTSREKIARLRPKMQDRMVLHTEKLTEYLFKLRIVYLNLAMHLVSSQLPGDPPSKSSAHTESLCIVILCVQITVQHVCRNAVAVNLVLDKASVENAYLKQNY